LNESATALETNAAAGDPGRYRALVEAAGDIIFTADAAGRFTYVNPRALETTGHRSAQLLGRSYLEIVAPAHRENLSALLKLQVLDRTPVTYVEFEALTASGGTIWIGQTVTLVLEHGAVTGFQAVARDIDARVQLEQQLRAQYEIALLMAGGGMDATGVGGEVVRTLCTRTGWDRGQLWLRRDAGHLELLTEWRPLEPAESAAEPLLLPGAIVREDESACAEPLWIADLRAAPWSSYGGGPMRSAMAFPIVLDSRFAGIVLLFARTARERDSAILHLAATVGAHLGQFLDRCRVHRELAVARDAALESSRMKSEFLANVSHEIRTPLHAIIGCGELLLRTVLDAEQRTLAATSYAAGGALLRVVDDILDFSAIESGRLAVECSPFDLRPAIAAVSGPIAVRAAEKSLAYRHTIAAVLPERVVGDERCLRQILRNLLDNAVKFTESGSVALSVESSGDDLVDFEVTDTGTGIPADLQRRLSEPFTQADGSMTRTVGGTGLGLAIARGLVERLGGELGIESAEGAGATVSFRIRLPPAPALVAVPAAEPWTAGTVPELRILVADDNAVNQQLIARQLQALGAACEIVADGRQAFARAMSRRYDLILMDLQMPLLDGFAATRLIRRWEADRGAPPTTIVAISANAHHRDRLRSLQAGMNEHLAKPLQLADLSVVLRRLAGVSPGGPPEAPRTRTTGPMLDASIIDGLRELADGDDAFLRDLIGQYRSDSDSRLEELERAATAGEVAAIHRLAHALRGSSANVGAIEVTAACRAVELSDAADARDYLEPLARIREAYERVLPLLSAAAG
jgi:PAS domain S-box-containing protein